MILLSDKTSGREQNHSFGRKPFFSDSSLGRKQEIVGSITGNLTKNDRQPEQQAEIG